MPWKQIHIISGPERSSIFEDILSEHGALSITCTDAKDNPIFEPPLNQTPLWKQTCITGLFASTTDEIVILRALSQLKLNDEKLHWEVLEDQPWEKAWMDRFKPMQFGSRLWICPTGQTVNADNATIVLLDPGLAFGTGTHPTTSLCLQWLDQAPVANKSVIDFGCGSGVLAVAALKLGAKSAIGIDHDPQALLASKDNAEKNHVSKQLSILSSQQALPKPADIVLANILASTLIELSQSLIAVTQPAGTIIMSGILENQADQVKQAFSGHFEFTDNQLEDGWALLIAVKK